MSDFTMPDAETKVAASIAFGDLMSELVDVGYFTAVSPELTLMHCIATGMLLREVAPAWCAPTVQSTGSKQLTSSEAELDGTLLADYLRELTERFPLMQPPGEATGS